MKFVKAMIYALYLFVYGYSTYMTSVEPNNVIWGYICVFVFAYLFIGLISTVVNNQKKNDDSENTSDNL